MAKTLTLEESFEKLDELVGKLEDGSLSLDEAFKCYKEGIKLVRHCNAQLDKVEKQMIILKDGEEGEDGV